MTPQQFSLMQKKSQEFRFENYKARSHRLQLIRKWILEHEDDIYAALLADFNKPHFETVISEVYPCLSEINYTLKNLKKWMKPQTLPTPIGLLGHKSWIRYENKGVVLIISPWNYPFQLAIIPLVSAIAAGNTVVIKPSELTTHTSQLIEKLVQDCFTENEVVVELGSKEKTQELLQFNFDHVFFTGSTNVGKLIAKSCAERLIPVTLELGGKSPTIVDSTADLDEAADKIFWSKYLNRAQTCVAPDYLLLQEDIAEIFVQKLKKRAESFDRHPKGHIINSAHHLRLQKMLAGPADLNLKTLEIMKAENTDHPSMKEEIFGPVLPYLCFKNIEETARIIDQFEKPLALYIFSNLQKNIDFILNRFSSGGVGINAVLVQFGNHFLPFGGVGHSGYGEYHGFYGFQQFSHRRSFIRSYWLKQLRLVMMPPYTPLKSRLINFMKKLA